ncbi:hypothetical protein Syun_010399 [Stephania yunnanensis]|uniref:Apple domain-containing protein n=1 Tax=Stephania yunnanensis TaxID=152371 RepID=A0AAP0KHD4_9MAGN
MIGIERIGRRRTALDCDNGDGFQRFSSAKVPDTAFSWVDKSRSLGECQIKRLKNCSCTAYANTDIRGSGSGCVLLFGDLIDIREFSEGAGQDLYVRLAASELALMLGCLWSFMMFPILWFKQSSIRVLTTLLILLCITIKLFSCSVEKDARQNVLFRTSG